MRGAAILCALTLITVVLPSPTLAAPAELATVYRDSFGVPHIDAPSQNALAYAMGFSLAEDRPFQLDVYRRAGQGRLTEILGAGEDADNDGTGDFLQEDILMRQEFFERSRIQAEIDDWDPDLRGLWDAYANGITAGWAAVIADPTRSPVEFAALGYEPEPWTMIDSAAVALLFTSVDNGGWGGGGELENAVFLGQLKDRFPAAEAGAISAEADGIWDDTLWINDPDATPVIPDSDAPPAPSILTSPPGTPPPSQLAFLDLPLPMAMTQSQDALLGRVMDDAALPKLGSYGVAIGPSQSASGNAMLLGAPQSGIAAPPLVWEVGMHAPGIDCAGAAVPGAGPFLVNGTCSHHAWTIVAGSAGDQVDVVIEQLSDVDNFYIYDDDARPFVRRTEQFLVRNTNPTSPTVPEFTTEEREFQRSLHGTVFSTDPDNDVAYVRKRAQEGHVLDNLASLFHLTEAQTIDEANDAIQEASWSVHIPYADTEGNIAYWFSGRNQLHAAGLDLRLPTPGHSSDFEWQEGLIPNPHVRNPSQGFLVANQGWDSKPVSWWSSSDEWRIGRLERRGVTEDIVRSLADADELDTVSFAEMKVVNRLACCDTDPLVGFLVDAMSEAVEMRSTPTTPAQDRREEALGLLHDWAESGFARVDVDGIGNGDGFYDAPGLAIWAADDMPSDVYGGTLKPGPVWDRIYPLVFDELAGRPSIGTSQEQLAPLERWLRHARAREPFTGLTPSRKYFDNISTTETVETWDELLVTALDEGLNVLDPTGTGDLSSLPKLPVNTIEVRALGALAVRDVNGFDHSSYNFISEIGTCNALSILPPGQGAPVSAADLLRYESDTSDPKANSAYPAHYIDQLEMYEQWKFKPLRLCPSTVEGEGFLDDVQSQRELPFARTAPNRSPNAVDDSAGTRQGKPVTINVVNNDYDPDGDPFTVTASTPPANGAASCTQAGVCTYSPYSNFIGTDSFTYTITDSELPEGRTDTATVTVIVGPPPSISITDVAVGEDSGTATFTLSLSQPLTDEATVDFATANATATAGFDYTAATGTATFASGQTTTTVDVTILEDSLDEENETFIVNLSNPTNATISAGGPGQGVGTITDNDPGPTISINDVTVEEGAGAATFTVALSTASGQMVTVNFATADADATSPADYASTSGTLAFAPGTTTQSVSIPVNADATFEPSETFFVNLSGATDATISDSQGVGTITNDDDQPSFAINDVTVNEGSSGTTTAVFTVTKTGATEVTATVTFATQDVTAAAGSDYQATSGTLTFGPTTTTQTVTVIVNSDTTSEYDETFKVHLAAAVNASISDSEGIGTITDAPCRPRSKSTSNGTRKCPKSVASAPSGSRGYAPWATLRWA